MNADFLSDPLWYKDAVIYELHVRSFFDANNDGYGDFQGLRQKLPYLESLGINTLWLLPFLESPLKDDGYDTADYYKILPVHGDLDDFKAFLADAKARGMRVITELVLNHTSDQHPWFQEARDPKSPKHDWYVWSDTTEKYADARIIFTDTEVSNWTWDRKAQRYYWHRFFSHQPDLNFDNPAVREALMEVMFFWFDLGIDGLRLDAVPYLYEREGTNCENLPETLAYIRALRSAVDERYGPGKVLLAEANQWPEDTLPYFGQPGKSDGVQMAFNFPIMPRMYMSLRRADRRPLEEMLALTEDIPDDAQWAIFLRNHDELTLEMVTDEERDYMYHEYAADSRFRINVGIRRRLAPLLGGDRRQIELMNALLLSLKGSPVLYYGDEIGMGDDPFLGDRNGVRTPMQWSTDKNGGFSRAPHQRLFMPPINRGTYSYEFVNAEQAQEDPHSLLSFMRQLIGIRKQHAQVFGRGSFTLLPVKNQSIIAFLRTYGDAQVLVVANLSGFAQSAHLHLPDHLAGHVPIELFGQLPFPEITEHPYPVMLGPHGFFWFLLQSEDPSQPSSEHAGAREHEAPQPDALPTLKIQEGLQNMLVQTMVKDRGMQRLEAILPAYLQRQRWFGAKDRTIESVRIEDAVRLQARPFPVYLVILKVHFANGSALYQLPLALAYAEAQSKVMDERPQCAVAWIQDPEGTHLLHDATVRADFWRALFRWWRAGGKGRSLRGLYLTTFAEPGSAHDTDPVHILSGEQSNSSAVLGAQYFVKLYRRLEEGPMPEPELLEHLTTSNFAYAPSLLGTLIFKRSHTTYTMGIVQEAVPMETDGWTYAHEMSGHFLDRAKGLTLSPDADHAADLQATPSTWTDKLAPEMHALARDLGIRTAEMHLALADAGAPDLRPAAATPADTTAFLERVRQELEQTRRLLDALPESPPASPDPDAWEYGLARLDALMDTEAPRQLIRVHGDYHLGQIAVAEGAYFILDFEGEPARMLTDRRRRDDALRDVAGMLRSFEYAALPAYRDRAGEPAEDLEAWTHHLIDSCQAIFLDAYFSTADDAAFLLPESSRLTFLWAYLLDKALYEVRYELGHRPDWVWLPLQGLQRLLSQDGSASTI